MIDLSKFKVADAFKDLPMESMSDGLSSGFASLRYKGKMWSLNLGGKSYPIKHAGYNSPFVDFVILGVSPHVSQIFFGEWNDDNATGPICASLKGDVPDPGVSIPQSKTCATCDQNQWGNKAGGGRGKPCQDHKRVAVLLMPDMTKNLLPAPLLEPVYFKIPPGSFKSWKKYDDELRHAGLRFSSLITRVSFVEGQQFEMKFDVQQMLTNAEAPLVLPMKESAQTLSILGDISKARQLAAPAAAPSSRQPERIETGLMAAFGAPPQEAAPARKPRAKKEIPIDIDRPPAPPQAAGNGETPWDESDDDLDDTVAKLMAKTSNMLK